MMGGQVVGGVGEVVKERDLKVINVLREECTYAEVLGLWSLTHAMEASLLVSSSYLNQGLL